MITGRPFVSLRPYVARAILRTVAAGWAVALPSADVHAGATEIAMTERLRDGMRHALNSGNLPWSRNMVVLPGTESRSRSEVLLPDGRTDIPICGSRSSFTSVNTIPMRSSSASASPATMLVSAGMYVVEGIDRFRSGKYAANRASSFSGVRREIRVLG